MEELLQAIKKKRNRKLHTDFGKKTPNNILSNQSLDCMQAFLQQGKEPCQKLIPTPFEPQPRWLSGPYFTSCLGCLTHLIKSIALVPSQSPHCLSLLQTQDNVQNTFHMEWFHMENLQFIQKERFQIWKGSKPLHIRDLYSIFHFCFMDMLIRER